MTVIFRKKVEWQIEWYAFASVDFMQCDLRKYGGKKGEGGGMDGQD